MLTINPALNPEDSFAPCDDKKNIVLIQAIRSIHKIIFLIILISPDDKYDIPNRKNDQRYSFWNEDYNEYINYKINDLKKKIAFVQNKKICVHCGSIIDKNKPYCQNCGQKVVVNEKNTNDTEEEYVVEILDD